MKAHPPYVSHDEQQIAEFRQHPDRALEYLTPVSRWHSKRTTRSWF